MHFYKLFAGVKENKQIAFQIDNNTKSWKIDGKKYIHEFVFSLFRAKNAYPNRQNNEHLTMEAIEGNETIGSEGWVDQEGGYEVKRTVASRSQQQAGKQASSFQLVFK